MEATEPTTSTQDDTSSMPQCRICLESEADAPELGKLIKPCRCSGTMSHVHVRCLQRWRTMSASRTAFYECPNCKYKYLFARTRAMGIGTNPVFIGLLSATLFTILVFTASFVTTALFGSPSDPDPVHDTSTSYYWSSHSYFYWFDIWDAIQTIKDLVKAAMRILAEDVGVDIDAILGVLPAPSPYMSTASTVRTEPGAIKRFIVRFLLGLPIIGAVSLVQMMLSLPLLGPLHWLARYRGRNRSSSRGTRNAAAIIVVGLLLLGAARVLWRVYRLTEDFSKRVLARAEDAILEVN